MPTAMAPETGERSHEERREIADLLAHFEATPGEASPALRGRAGTTVEQLAAQGQVPAYLVVEPQDPDPVVERILLAVLRRLSLRQR